MTAETPLQPLDTAPDGLTPDPVLALPGGDVSTQGTMPDDDQGDPKTYDETYVRQLREEAASNRVKAKRLDDAETRLRAMVISDTARNLLADPSDLPWSEGMADADGWPDPALIAAAANDLVAKKPHLGLPAGAVGQGHHSDADDTVSLTGMLRARA
jgi:hypothetical protein